MKMAIAELTIAIAALASIGTGLWMYQPWVALVGVGTLVLALTVAGRIKRA